MLPHNIIISLVSFQVLKKIIIIKTHAWYEFKIKSV